MAISIVAVRSPAALGSNFTWKVVLPPLAAKRLSEGNYRIRYRRLRSKDMLMTFGDLCFRHRDALERREETKPLLNLAEGEARAPAAAGRLRG